MIAAILFLPQGAMAWECDICGSGCEVADGSQSTYHVNVNDFTAAQQTAIGNVANAWDAGSGTNNPGADWDFIRGSDTTSDGFTGNGTNNVRMKDDQWFFDNGFPTNVPAVTSTVTLGCLRIEADVTYRSSVTWSTLLPSAISSPTTLSFGQVTVHEFGHYLGLEHETSVSGTAIPATMNPVYPAGGELGATKYRIGEDDYMGLVAVKSDSSTGRNLMLGKFQPGASGTSVELWTSVTTDPDANWTGCPGETLPSISGPSAIWVHAVGTSNSTVDLAWRLSADSTCFSGVEYGLATRTITVGSNVPSAVSPSAGYTIPALTPPGDYYLCAKIDSGNDVAETSEADNIIISEKLFEVSSCP